MRLGTQAIRMAPWFGVAIGLFICNMPLIAEAVPFTPQKRGIPGRREGGGTRDSGPACLKNGDKLTALQPENGLSQTSVGFPQFFWYNPTSQAKTAVFAIHEAKAVGERFEKGAVVYETTFNIASTPGIASIPLPRTAGMPPLVTGKDYRWSVKLVCPPNTEAPPEVYGWVQRVALAPDLVEKLKKTPVGDRYKVYAAGSLWNDTLMALAGARYLDPSNQVLAKEWAELLKSVGLEKLGTQPLMGGR